MDHQAEQTGDKSFTIRRGKVDSLSVYEITDYELDILERGSPSSLYLNFGIFLLSTSVSFLVALLTTTIQSNRTFTVFVVLVVVGIISGIVLMGLWYRTRQSASKVIAKIRSRIPPDGAGDENDEGGN